MSKIAEIIDQCLKEINIVYSQEKVATIYKRLSFPLLWSRLKTDSQNSIKIILKQLHNCEPIKVINMQLLIEVNYNYLPECLCTQQIVL